MANENGVKIGNIKRMGGGTTPPPPVDELPPWSERDAGLPAFLSAIDKNRTDAIKREQARTQQGWNWLAGTPSSPPAQTPMFSDGRVLGAMQGEQTDTGGVPYASAGGQHQMTVDDLIAM